MPLSILVPMILIGLPLVIGLVYYTNREKKTAELTEAMVRELFAVEHPNIPVGEVFIDKNGKTALVASDSKLCGIVTRFGKKHITRLVDSKFVKAIKASGEDIDVWTNDFTLRHIKFQVPDGGNYDDLSRLLMEVEKIDGSGHP